jgi:hypothetical protein
VPVGYRVENEELVVFDGRGVRFRGRPGGFPVAKAVPVPESRDAIVLLRFYGDGTPDRFATLLRVRPDGEIVWRTPPPEKRGDAWVRLAWSKRDGLNANSWSCYWCKLDPATGRLTSSAFTK